ncbi:MAG: hypothetical protein LBL62_00185 [Planctomycetaceae bacterium]|nr:hypothetical protein [Planctomycetaceae bacterium]
MSEPTYFVTNPCFLLLSDWVLPYFERNGLFFCFVKFSGDVKVPLALPPVDDYQILLVIPMLCHQR